jgi:hypothetical protein
MKTVTLPIEEYEQLLQDSKDKQRLMDEIEADASERGYMVRYVSHFWRRTPSELKSDYEFLTERNTLEIFSKDKVLADAQAEIERLSNLCEELKKKNDVLHRYSTKLENRGFFARLFNKLD